MRVFVILYCLQFASARSVNLTTSNPVATTQAIPTTSALTRYEEGLEDYDEAKASASNRQARGMMMDYDDHHDYPVKVEQKAVKTDPWAGYYDFIINEGSFKFWAAFQLGTALLLTYSAFAAVYYAKFNPITSDYDYYDDFFFRSKGRSSEADSTSSWFHIDAQTVQRILNAITSKKYS